MNCICIFIFFFYFCWCCYTFSQRVIISFRFDHSSFAIFAQYAWWKTVQKIKKNTDKLTGYTNTTKEERNWKMRQTQTHFYMKYTKLCEKLSQTKRLYVDENFFLKIWKFIISFMSSFCKIIIKEYVQHFFF